MLLCLKGLVADGRSEFILVVVFFHLLWKKVKLMNKKIKVALGMRQLHNIRQLIVAEEVQR